MKQTVIRSLEVLASALGRRQGVRVEVTGTGTACTDGKTIYLPLAGHKTLDEETRTLVRGYIDHEAAHVRWTQLPDSVTTLFNILEDVRVEKLMMEHYPGSALNLEQLVTMLHEKHGAFPAPQDDWSPMATAGGYIVCALRANVLGQTVLSAVRDDARAKCVERFGDAKVDALDAFLSGFHPASSEDCLRMCEEIKHILGLSQSVNSTPENNTQGEDEHPGDNPQSKNPVQSPPGDNPHGENSGDTSQDEISGHADPGDNPQGMDPVDSAPASPDDDESLKRYDVSSRLSDIITSIGKDMSRDSTYIPITAAPKESIMQRKIDPTQYLRTADYISSGLRSALVDHIQTMGMARQRVTRQGINLDSRRIARVGVGDSRIFKGVGRARQLNAAIYVVLDRSGSMERKVFYRDRLEPKYAVADTVTLALLKAALPIPQIQIEVVCFPVPYVDAEYIHVMHPMGRKQITTTDPLFTYPFGGTPLHLPIRYLHDHISTVQAQGDVDRHIVLIVTDGDPDDLNSALSAVHRLRGIGADVYCLGLPGAGKYFLGEAFGPRNSRIVSKVELLPKYIGELLLTRVLA